jgi:hypothetical protein
MFWGASKHSVTVHLRHAISDPGGLEQAWPPDLVKEKSFFCILGGLPRMVSGNALSIRLIDDKRLKPSWVALPASFVHSLRGYSRWINVPVRPPLWPTA